MTYVLIQPAESPVVVLSWTMTCGCMAYWYAWQRAVALAAVNPPAPRPQFDPSWN